MLKLTGAPGAYRVIDDQTGAVVLNATSAHYVHEAGSPPVLSLEVQGALIDARVMVAGELCHIEGDGRNTDVTASDGTTMRNIRSVDVHAGPAESAAVVALAEAVPTEFEPEQKPEPESDDLTHVEEANQPEMVPLQAGEVVVLDPAPAEVAVDVDPTEGGSAVENANETSNDAVVNEAPTPVPRSSRRPRG